jgi:hypothetical protein
VQFTFAGSQLRYYFVHRFFYSSMAVVVNVHQRKVLVCKRRKG